VNRPIIVAFNTMLWQIAGDVDRQLALSTQPRIPPGSLNQASALVGSFNVGWGNLGGKVTSAGRRQVTPCDLIRHVSCRSGETSCELLLARSVYTSCQNDIPSPSPAP